MSGPHSDKVLERASAEDQTDWSSVPIVAALPASMYPAEGGEEVFARLQGAKIIRIGALAIRRFEGGGLALDYTLPDSVVQHRIIFAFNELGMWVEFDSFHNSGDIIITDHAMTQEEVAAMMLDQS